MVLLIGAWISCGLLTLWALYVAGRLRSTWWARIALLAGFAPIGWLIARQVPSPSLEPFELLALALGSTVLLGVWGTAVHWARRAPAAPRVDASRMRWVPRPSHRPTWVIVAGLSTLLTLALIALDRPLVAILPWLGVLLAHRWAHQGERGAVRVEARDVVLGGERIPIDELSLVAREVQYLGPLRRERLVLHHGERQLCWLVTGSPAEDVVAVEHLLRRQQDFALSHEVAREPQRRPPAWLRDIHERSARPLESSRDVP